MAQHHHQHRPWRLPNAALVFLGILTFFTSTATAVTIEHNFNITWIWANPDGNFDRPVISINNQWPPPQLNATAGDTLIINTWNNLGNQSTSLHFHGIYMNTTAHMDGTSGVSQCAIRPGESFTYKFRVQQAGTYWYHSHTKSQYPDGLRGMMVIKDPMDPYKDEYTEELSISLSDWYHNDMTSLLTAYDLNGGDPDPDSVIINDVANSTVAVKPGTTYLVHLANMAAFAGIYFWIEDHVMQVVEADGTWTKKKEATSVYLAAGQRYSFLLTTKEDGTVNFPMVALMDDSLLYASEPRRAVSHLLYSPASPLPPAKYTPGVIELDDMDLIPYDELPAYTNVQQTISLTIGMGMSMHGGHHWMFNTTQYFTPELPSLFSTLSAKANATNPEAYIKSSSPIVLEHNKVVEIVIQNRHMMDHPIHLHGHSFQVLRRTTGDHFEGQPDAWDALDADSADPAVRANATAPLRRDTVLVRNGGSARIRFRSDNPGVWLLHCHMEWHAHSGLVATVIEAPVEVQRQGILKELPVGTDSKRVCEGQEVREAMKWEDIPGGWRVVSGGSGMGGGVPVSSSVASGFAGLVIIGGAAGLGAWWVRRRKRLAGEAEGEKGEYELVKAAEEEEALYDELEARR